MRWARAAVTRAAVTGVAVTGTSGAVRTESARFARAA
jgi:hypothetical protein